MSELTSGEKAIVGIITAIIIPAAIISEGYALSKLWEWFAVRPLGLPHIGVNTAIGLSILIGLATFRYIKNPESEGLADSVGRIFVPLAAPWIALISGWLVLAFS